MSENNCTKNLIDWSDRCGFQVAYPAISEKQANMVCSNANEVNPCLLKVVPLNLIGLSKPLQMAQGDSHRCIKLLIHVVGKAWVCNQWIWEVFSRGVYLFFSIPTA